MATLTGSRNMHHWTFTLNLNFATGMWKQTFHDDLECHKLMFEKISVQHVLSTHALMSKGPDQGRLKKGLGFSKWRVCLKNCSFWEVCVDQFYFEQCHSQDNMIGHTETIFAAVHRGHFIIARRGKHTSGKWGQYWFPPKCKLCMRATPGSSSQVTKGASRSSSFWLTSSSRAVAPMG